MVANKLFYNGVLKDDRSVTGHRPDGRISNSPLVLFDTSSADPWASRLDGGSRYCIYSAAVAWQAFERLGRPVKSVGIITPYAAQARLIRLMADDHGCKDLQVSTVHRFQGMEMDSIIFDIAESPPARKGIPPFLSGQELDSDAAKLLNVALTRAKYQFILIAHCQYLQSKVLSEKSYLRQLVQQLQRREKARSIQHQNLLKITYARTLNI